MSSGRIGGDVIGGLNGPGAGVTAVGAATDSATTEGGKCTGVPIGTRAASAVDSAKAGGITGLEGEALAAAFRVASARGAAG